MLHPSRDFLKIRSRSATGNEEMSVTSLLGFNSALRISINCHMAGDPPFHRKCMDKTLSLMVALLSWWPVI